MGRGYRAVGVALALGVVAALAVTWHARELRFDAIRALAAERSAQLQSAVARAEADLADVVEDLRVTATLLEQAANGEESRRDVHAVLSVSQAYVAAAVFDATGLARLVVGGTNEAIDGANRAISELAPAAVQAGRMPTGTVWWCDSAGTGPSGSARGLFLRLPDASTSGVRTVAFVVDLRPILAPLRSLAAMEGVELVLVDAAGGLDAVTTDRARGLVRSLDEAGGSLPPSVERWWSAMRRGESGTIVVPGLELKRVGLGADDHVVAYAPLVVPGSGAWSAATISSTAALVSYARDVEWHVGSVGAWALVAVGTFGALGAGRIWRRASFRLGAGHEQRMAEMRRVADKVVDHIPTGLLLLGESGRVAGMNRSFRDRVETASIGDELPGALPRASGEALEALHALRDRARGSGRPEQVQFEGGGLFGRPGDFVVHGVPLRSGLAEADFLFVFDDVTEIQRLFRQLVQSEKLATVGLVASKLAHEVATPLSIIRARNQVALARPDPDDASGAVHRLTIRQIDRVVRTIQQLLGFARPGPTSRSGVRLATVAEAACELLLAEAARARVRLRRDALPDDLPPLDADADQLEALLLILLKNAIEATPPGGEVRLVATAEVAESAPAAGLRVERIHVEIQDTGAGIAPDALERVFEPFFTTKAQGTGTGLGLAIAQNIVHRHGATLELTSEVGKGTTVRCSWPARGSSGRAA